MGTKGKPQVAFVFAVLLLMCIFLKWVQALGAVMSEIVGWTSVSYEWSMAFKATINDKIQVTSNRPPPSSKNPLFA